LSAQDFEVLRTEIRERAKSMERQTVAASPLSDEDWASLAFAPFRVDAPVEFCRAWLNELGPRDAARYAYRAILGREADSEGLRSLEEQLQSGMPVNLMVGHMMLSEEGRRLTRWELGFGLYRILAGAHKAAKRIGRQRWIEHLAARLTLIHKRWDSDRMFRYYWKTMDLTMKAWHPALTRLSGQLGVVQQRMDHVDSSFDQMQRRVSHAISALRPPTERIHRQAPQDKPCLSQDEIADFYLAFEDANRGDVRNMESRCRPYAYVLERVCDLRNRMLEESRAMPQQAALLDLGCGRGEWLRYVSQFGLPAIGVDSSASMVRSCQAQGLQVYEEDLLQRLRGTEPSSLCAVTGFHVAEHLPFEALYELVKRAHSVLSDGGVLVLETPNPENLLVATHTFYHDPTHRNPLTPTAMEFLLHYHGFRSVEILRLHPYPEEAQIPSEGLAAQRLNGLLTGPQDFAVIGTK
jgi:O-antigen chain-terminating methyltransferase